MSNSSDSLFNARLQAEQGTQSQVTMRVDNRILAAFKARAEMMGSSYQTLMNDALRQFVEGQTLADVVRETIQHELHRDEA